MKTMRTALKFAAVLLLLAVLGSCGFLGGNYTVRVRNYTSTGLYHMYYRESGTTAWKEADLVDEEGSGVMKIEYNNSSYEDTAYFDLPGPGTYDFVAANVLGGDPTSSDFSVFLIGPPGNEILTDCAVDMDNMGDLYFYSISISTSDSIHDFY